MTLRDAKQQLAVHDMTINKKDGEYRVNFKGGNEATAYYTDDLDEAFETGYEMFFQRHISENPNPNQAGR